MSCGMLCMVVLSHRVVAGQWAAESFIRTPRKLNLCLLDNEDITYSPIPTEASPTKCPVVLFQLAYTVY